MAVAERPDTGATPAGGEVPAPRTPKRVPPRGDTTRVGDGAQKQRAESSGGGLGDLFAPVAGFGVTFATMFRKVATEEYPEEKRPTEARWHGRHQLNRGVQRRQRGWLRSVLTR